MSSSGALISFQQGKSFGFIKRDDGQGDVFVHVRQLRNGGEQDMIIGTRFSFDIEADEKSGKNKATNVTITQPGTPGQGGPAMGVPQNTGPREKCGDFLAGRCTRGDRCKYSHDTGMGGPSGPFMGGGGGGARSSPYGGSPAPAYGGGGGLPAGWEQITDPASGRPYYCNRSTGQSSWEPPQPAQAPPPQAPPPQPQLPPGWEQITDPASGRPYYCNRSTGQSSWEWPR